MAEKISAVYKITNTVTKDFYIGSSNNVKHRWACHKCPSRWNKNLNNQMYKDMQKYGLDKFEFQVITEVKPEQLKETEQKFIETLKPTYNSNRASGWDIERYIEHQIEYYQQNREKRKEYQNKYQNQTCFYNGETLTLATLAKRFQRSGITHPTAEARKYLIL